MNAIMNILFFVKNTISKIKTTKEDSLPLIMGPPQEAKATSYSYI